MITLDDAVLIHEKEAKQFLLKVPAISESPSIHYVHDVMDKSYTLYHSEVPEQFRGQGIGAVLAKQVFQAIFKEEPEAKLILTCSYLQNYYLKNRELFPGKNVTCSN